MLSRQVPGMTLRSTYMSGVTVMFCLAEISYICYNSSGFLVTSSVPDFISLLGRNLFFWVLVLWIGEVWGVERGRREREERTKFGKDATFAHGTDQNP